MAFVLFGRLMCLDTDYSRHRFSRPSQLLSADSAETTLTKMVQTVNVDPHRPQGYKIGTIRNMTTAQALQAAQSAFVGELTTSAL